MSFDCFGSSKATNAMVRTADFLQRRFQSAAITLHWATNAARVDSGGGSSPFKRRRRDREAPSEPRERFVSGLSWHDILPRGSGREPHCAGIRYVISALDPTGPCTSMLVTTLRTVRILDPEPSQVRRTLNLTRRRHLARTAGTCCHTRSPTDHKVSQPRAQQLFRQALDGA